MSEHSPYSEEIKFERIHGIISENVLNGIGAPNNWKDGSKYFGYVSTGEAHMHSSARIDYADGDGKPHSVRFSQNVAFFINYTDKIIFAIPGSYTKQ